MSEFWKNQPVLQHNENSNEVKIIQEIKDVRLEPYNLPEGFSWKICTKNDLESIYHLILYNYVEDVDNIFSLSYSREFLRWCLFPYDANDDTVRLGIEFNNVIIGFVSAYPAQIKVCDKEYKVGMVNFLSVHKNLRDKRMAPVLIKEILRQGHLLGYYTSVYTNTKAITKPFCTSTCYFYPIKIDKLIRIGFIDSLSPRTLKHFKLNYKCREFKHNYFSLTEEYYEDAYNLFKNNMKYKVYPIYSLNEFVHWFAPTPSFLYTYIKLTNGRVTDIFSFYELPSRVKTSGEVIKAAYSWYNIATTMSYDELIYDSIYLAYKEGFDVYKSFRKSRKFMETVGILHYHFHNLSCPTLDSNDVNLLFH